MASPLTAYSASSDGRVECYHTTYATAYGGANAASDSANAYIGQTYSGGTYYLDHMYMNFDTSDIPDDATIDTVTLSLYGRDDQSTTDFTMEIYSHDWGDTLTSGDWVTPATAGGLTRVAYKATAGGISTSAYTDFTSDAAFLSTINKTGLTRLVGISSRFIATTQPSGAERVRFYVSEDTGKEPKLVVAYTESGTSIPVIAHHYHSMRG